MGNQIFMVTPILGRNRIRRRRVDIEPDRAGWTLEPVGRPRVLGRWSHSSWIGRSTPELTIAAINPSPSPVFRKPGSKIGAVGQ